jgi:RNA methyltransferase, TrmH family
VTGGGPLSSTHNPRFRAALALRERRERWRQRRILIDGVREIGRALDAGIVPVEAWLDVERPEGTGARDLAHGLASAGVPVVAATRSLVGRLAYGERDEGIVLVAEAPEITLTALPPLPREPLVAVLERVEKPGNLGAVLRSADGAGVSALVLADPVADPHHPNVIRASLGTVFTVPVAQASTPEVLDWLHTSGIRILAARVDAGPDHTATDMRGPLAIVLGSEAEGLSDAWSGEDLGAVRIPMLGVADSLNVSVTAAVLFYEALRQRRESAEAG